MNANRSARVCRSLVLLMAALLPAASAHGFVCLQTDNGRCLHWAQGGATLRSLLGNPGQALINGTLTWDQNALNAANDWNIVGAAFQFTVLAGGAFIDPCGPQGPGHACPNTGPAGDNLVFFIDSVCGQGFGDIIAQTTNCFDGSGAMINAPVFVNNAVPWNAYDGAGRPPINDIRRVLLHEFGHVLGLDHPDKHNQQVTAIMNSQESDLDRLQDDDRAGIQFLYPHTGPPTGCQMDDSRGAASVWVFLAPAAIALLRFRYRLYRRTDL